MRKVLVWLKKAGVGAPAKDANRAMFLATAYMPLSQNQYIARFMPKNPRQKTLVKPKTDGTKQPSPLVKFLAQLRFQPPEAALPCNLSVELLELVAGDLDAMLNEVQPQDAGSRPDAVSLGLVLHILAGQPSDGKPGILLADIFAAMEDYRLEITKELKKRRTGIHSIPATMETIFKRRGANARSAPLTVTASSASSGKFGAGHHVPKRSRPVAKG